MEMVANPQLTRVDTLSQDSLVHGCGQSLNFIIFAMIFAVFHPKCLSKEFRILF